MNTVHESNRPEHVQLNLDIVESGVPKFVIAQRVGISPYVLSRILAGRAPVPADLPAKIRGAIAADAEAAIAANPAEATA